MAEGISYPVYSKGTNRCSRCTVQTQPLKTLCLRFVPWAGKTHTSARAIARHSNDEESNGNHWHVSGVWCLTHFLKYLGRHSGSFQCDEALGVWLLRRLPKWADATLTRTRDNAVLANLAHLLSLLAGAFIIMEDSFGITSRQFGIHTCLQSAFQCLVHCLFPEIIMLFSSCNKDSRYPASRCRAGTELSPHSS